MRISRAGARTALHEALAYFEAAGAEPWAEQTRAELRASGETAAHEANGSLRSLTPQELQVALIVAKGPRIVRQLPISCAILQKRSFGDANDMRV